jgi:hypothetical protein
MECSSLSSTTRSGIICARLSPAHTIATVFFWSSSPTQRFQDVFQGMRSTLPMLSSYHPVLSYFKVCKVPAQYFEVAKHERRYGNSKVYQCPIPSRPNVSSNRGEARLNRRGELQGNNFECVPSRAPLTKLLETLKYTHISTSSFCMQMGARGCDDNGKGGAGSAGNSTQSPLQLLLH